jgi:hypothetical protein
VGILDKMKSLLTPPTPQGVPERHLDGGSEAALSASLQTLVRGARGWVALDEARRLFSSRDGQYAFGEMDEDGKAKLDSFAARNRCAIDIMPEGRVYFTRTA